MHHFVQTLKQHNFLQNQKSVNSTVMKIKFTSKLSKTLKQLECIIGSLIKKNYTCFILRQHTTPKNRRKKSSDGQNYWKLSV